MTRKIAIAGLAGLFVALATAWMDGRARAQNGSTATATPMMLPHLPQVTVRPLPGYGTAPMVVGFMLGSSDPTVQFRAFRWSFGDGEVSTLPPIALFHTYKTPGSYVVTVTATTADGHQATGFAGVVVRPPN